MKEPDLKEEYQLSELIAWQVIHIPTGRIIGAVQEEPARAGTYRGRLFPGFGGGEVKYTDTFANYARAVETVIQMYEERDDL